jgi:protein-disulfide isomerase
MPFHKQAVTAHKAALAAAEEGRFWEMHRLLFAHQDRLDAGAVREHAAALGIDLEVFDAYVASDEGVKAIQADRELARKLGVLGVPAFFVNGRLVAGAQPFEVFSQVIEEELKAPGPER